MAAQGGLLPEYDMREYEGHLKCGREVQGYLHMRCMSSRQEQLAASICKRRVFCIARIDSVSLIRELVAHTILFATLISCCSMVCISVVTLPRRNT